MELRGKRNLIIDTETTGLPICRSKMPKHMKYPNPKYSIAYSSARLISVAFILDDSINDNISDINKCHFIRNNSDLDKSLYKTNGAKFADGVGVSIREILDSIQSVVERCDYIVGHNVLFDINIIAHEAYLANHPLYEILMSKIDSVSYFCTLEAATRMGVDSRFSTLEDVYKFMNDGYAFSAQKLEFHDAMDDVKACSLILDRMIANSFTIPAKILAIMDEIYPPNIFINDVNKDINCEDNNITLKIYLYCNGFDFYREKISYSHCSYNAAGLAIFQGVSNDIGKIKFQSINGVYILETRCNSEFNSELHKCYYAIYDDIYKCNNLLRHEFTSTETCGELTLGYETCDKCADSTSVYEAYNQLIEIPFNQFNTYTTAEVKSLIPKDKSRRSGIIELEVYKRGRSNTVSADKVDFYIKHEMYKYFSLKIGSVKY
jgi:DNA polymerase III epsilon subunit-like protein